LNKRRPVLGLVVLAALILTVSAVQAAPVPPSGSHYTLNIIGVDKPKNPAAPGFAAPDRHTIFVQKTGVTNIAMQQNNTSFAVLDAYGMDGNASLQIGPGFYDVYARATGKPGQGVTITPNTTYQTNVTINGTQTFALANSTLGHTKKPEWVKLTGMFFPNVTLDDNTTNTSTAYNATWAFNIGNLSAYGWSFDNHGQSPVEIRFYPVNTQPMP
jgi:hypothetical protein